MDPIRSSWGELYQSCLASNFLLEPKINLDWIIRTILEVGWFMICLYGCLAVDTKYTEGHSFWVKIENDPLFKNIAIHSVMDILSGQMNTMCHAMRQSR